MSAVIPALSTVTYQPGTLVCRRDWRTDEIRPDIGNIPTWTVTTAAGTTITVSREQDEVNGYARTLPGERWRIAYDMGNVVSWVDVFGIHRRALMSTPMVPSSHGDAAKADEAEIMNTVLRPLAFERTWAELLADCTPCDHTSQYCCLNEEAADL